MDVIDVLGEVLQYAIGVAVSPVPIAAVIVILFTPKADTNAPAFLIGWILGMLAVGSVVEASTDDEVRYAVGVHVTGAADSAEIVAP